jgi:quinol-cytochrome oxidoreductase complex cytochrome b subunit
MPSEKDPQTVGDRRVLGIVPGRPPVGDRKAPQEEQVVMTSPHLLVRHAVVAVAVLLLVLLISICFDAPLREIANPTLTPNPEKAPWYFAALQELLSLLHPQIAGVLVPAGILIGLVALPYIDRNPAKPARLRKVAVVTFTIFMVSWIVLTIIGFAFRGPNWSWVWPWQEWYGVL